MQLLKNGNVWHIHGWQMRTLFSASSLSRRGETALLAGNARSLWPLEAVALSLLILYLFKRRSFLEKFSQRGVNITFIGPLNCLPEKYILNTYQRNISLSGKIVTKKLICIVQDKWKKVVAVYNSCRTFTERSAIFGRTQTLEHVVLVFCHDASVLAVITLNKKNNDSKFSLVK